NRLELDKGCGDMLWVFTYLILIIVISSVVQFIFTREYRTDKKVWIAYDIFYTLLIIYIIVIIGFSFLYYMLSFYDVVLYEENATKEQSLLDMWWRSFYFSGVTMLTIGYGDVIPLGVGRLFALLQALIGFILPTAFVLKVVHLNIDEKNE